MSTPDWADNLMTGNERIAAGLANLAKALGQLAPAVIDVSTVIIGADGTAAGQYRVPYKALTVDSQSAQLLTVANGPRSTAPASGPGVAYVPAGKFRVLNLTGYAWTIYGGTPGDKVTVSAYASPQPPAAT
jgi:hypothetical protein